MEVKKDMRNVKLKRKSLMSVLMIAVSFSMVMMSFSTAQAFSDESGVGDIYMVSTIIGRAWTRIEGELVKGSITVELTCRVTETFPDLVLFKPVIGTIVMNDTIYHVNQAWWRGIFYKRNECALIEGSATSDDGETIHFILHTRDVEHYQGGTFMKAVGGIRDSNQMYWKTRLHLWRYKFNE